MILTFQNTGLIKSGALLGGIKEPTPPSPVLPSFTIRVKFSQGYTPTMGDTQTLVDAEENIWDITKNSTDWSSLLRSYDGDTEVLEVLVANTTGVTNMIRMFYNCTKLTTVPLFDTSSVTSMERMFYNCTKLTTVPLFDTSNVTKMNYMFYNCRNVQSGALALYQQTSSQTIVPTHGSTFYNCGINTTTGAAELAQIPLNWQYDDYED